MSARQLIARSQRLVATSLRSRPFSAAAMRWSGKEDMLHHEGRAQDVEAKKAESLREQRDGKGEWKEDLGSSSESIIKAERGETKTTKETITKLQEEAKKVGSK